MRNFIVWLQAKEIELAKLANADPPDFDDIWHTTTDEELESMIEDWKAMQNNK